MQVPYPGPFHGVQCPPLPRSVDLLNRSWNFDGTQFNSAVGTMMLPGDRALIDDTIMRGYVEAYAADELRFFTDFAAAFQKLAELGWRSLAHVPIDWQATAPAERAVAGGATMLKDGLTLSWAPHTNDTITVKLQLEAEVPWLALAVSSRGYMVDEPPSRAVIGTTWGVQQRTLREKNTDCSDCRCAAAMQPCQRLPLLHSVQTFFASLLRHSARCWFAIARKSSTSASIMIIAVCA